MISLPSVMTALCAMAPTKPKSGAPLYEQLQAALQALNADHYWVAFSGGLDSTALLHLLRDHPKVSAIHVNHGMQASADAWQTHCERYCAQWRVPLTVKNVSPDLRAGGPEAGARQARYAAIADTVQSGDVLLTAQHEQDQAETFLLQALRGAGPRGLASMPHVAEFAAGRIARPLLNVPRQQLSDYVQAHNLQWVDDPSNADPHLDRSFLRHRISPVLDEHWPGFAQRLARTARWCASASELNDELAQIDWQHCQVFIGQVVITECLSIDAIRTLSCVRQDNLLRYWITQQGLPTPDHRHMQQMRGLLGARRPDVHPVVSWADTELRRHQDWLFVMPKLAPAPLNYSALWNGQSMLELPSGCGRLEMHGPYVKQNLSVRFRRGGERIRLNGRRHSTRLKQLLQTAKMPDWVRERLPLIYRDGELVAIADFWHSEALAGPDIAAQLSLSWHNAPPGTQLARVVGNHAFR